MLRRFAIQIALPLVAAAALSACAKTGGNPYRYADAYSSLPYEMNEDVQVLSMGELHYN